MMESHHNGSNLITPAAGNSCNRGGAAPLLPRLPFISHVLQHSLRALCSDRWVYSVFWRILPRHYPPPKWDNDAGPFDRNKGNKRNWILVWEDGYCDFVACSRDALLNNTQNNPAKLETAAAVTGCSPPHANSCSSRAQQYMHDHHQNGGSSSSTGSSPSTASGLASMMTVASGSPPPATTCTAVGLQPELFFKMSHDVYNYGEGLMGKVAADNSHKWIFRDPSEQEAPFLTPWQGSLDTYPRTWEAQFRAGIQTIAIIAVGEGLLQLGSTNKIAQDVDFVLRVQRKFNYLQSVPGVFAHHPSAPTPPPFDVFSTSSRSFMPPSLAPPASSRLPLPMGTTTAASNSAGGFYGSDWLLPPSDDLLPHTDATSSCRSWAAPPLPPPKFGRRNYSADMGILLGRRYMAVEAEAEDAATVQYDLNYRNHLCHNGGVIKEEMDEEGEGDEFEEVARADHVDGTDNDCNNEILSPPSSKRARVLPSMSSLQALLSKLPAVASTGVVVPPHPMPTLLSNFVPPQPARGGGASAAEDQLIARLIS